MSATEYEGSPIGTPSRKVGELVGIQYLRGVAAVMVLAYHMPVQLVRMGYDGAWLSGLASGVDIFYVISGFIMWVTTVDRPHETPLSFWRRRLRRIVPLYWIVTGFVTAMLLLLPGLLQSAHFDIAHVVTSFLFIGHSHPVTHMIEPLVIPGWTLNHEMFFYLIFGLFLLAPPRLRCAAMVSTLVLLVLLGWWIGFADNSVGDFYTSSILLEFALGIGIGVLASTGAGLTRMALPWGWAMLILGTAAIFFPLDAFDVPRLLGRGLASGVLVMGLLLLEAHHGLFRSPFLHRLGNASYSIYLSHMITLSAISQLWRTMGLPTNVVGLCAFVGVALLIGLFAGWMLYLFVERPISRRLQGGRRSHAHILAD